MCAGLPEKVVDEAPTAFIVEAVMRHQAGRLVRVHLSRAAPPEMPDNWLPRRARADETSRTLPIDDVYMNVGFPHSGACLGRC
ncbi:MAG: hypothetical protein ACXW3M_14795, partial [Rhodoplanes sp.]